MDADQSQLALTQTQISSQSEKLEGLLASLADRRTHSQEKAKKQCIKIFQREIRRLDICSEQSIASLQISNSSKLVELCVCKVARLECHQMDRAQNSPSSVWQHWDCPSTMQAAMRLFGIPRIRGISAEPQHLRCWYLALFFTASTSTIINNVFVIGWQVTYFRLRQYLIEEIYASKSPSSACKFSSNSSPMPIERTVHTLSKWTLRYAFCKYQHRHFAGVSMIEAFIWIFLNYSEKMKK